MRFKRFLRSPGGWATLIGGLTAVIAICGVVALLSALIFVAVKPVSDVSDAFLSALRDERYAEARAMLSRSLQFTYRDAKALEAHVREYKLRPASWFTNGVSSDESSDGHASTNGTMTFASGAQGTFNLTFVKQGNQWVVDAFDLAHR